MLLAISLIIVGFVLLTISAEYAVMGAVAIANKLRIPTIIVGLTIVAFGTSAPEFVVSIKAAISGNPGISLGNVIGSNIANIALILGVAAVITPIVSKVSVWSFDYIVLFISTILFTAFCLMGKIVMWQGLIFISIMAGFIYFNYKNSKENEVNEDEAKSAIAEKNWFIVLGVTILGFAGIIYGSDILVTGAVDLAKILGVSDAIIGLTIIAIGTSLPELATSVMAALRKQNDIALGNIVGSNIWNILFIIGATTSIVNVDVPYQLMRYDVWIMLFVTLLFLVYIWYQRRLDKWAGIFLLTIYSSYVVSQVLIAKGIFNIG